MDYLKTIIAASDIDKIIEYLSYAYNNKNQSERILFMVGPGQNGKTTFSEIMSYIYKSLYIIREYVFDKTANEAKVIMYGDYKKSIIIESNVLPNENEDAGFLRRLTVIHFPNKFANNDNIDKKKIALELIELIKNIK